MRPCILVLLAALAACSARPGSATRSPSHDYPPPARTTADGETLGADRRSPADTIDSTRSPPKPEPE